MRIGIYSGSFDPVHKGHIGLAKALLQGGYVDEVWMIRSPHNPLKEASDLTPDHHRLAMLQAVAAGVSGVEVSDIEDHLPKPSYTISTLDALHSAYPEYEFHLIIGADNWLLFPKWREWQRIVNEYHLLVYPRPGYPLSSDVEREYPHVRVVDADLYDVSSTMIRERCRKGESISDLVPVEVERYIGEHSLYGTPNG